jgi:polyisoprenoid-binding protein YceI
LVKQKNSVTGEQTMRPYFSRAGIGMGLAAIFSISAFAGGTTYKIDPQNSSAQFAVTHLMISKVRGEFHAVTGTVNVDEGDVAKSSVEVTIDASTIDTLEAARDKDLKSPNFLDVAKYPTITFKSTKVETGAPGHLKVTGDLTIHGVTKSVILDVTAPKSPIKDPWGLQRTAVSGTTKINRQDFGITYSPTLDNGGLVVSNEVEITLDVEMIVAPAK